MIPHESKAKLEKMAHAMCDRLSDSPCGRAYHAMYITGAQAAWKMAIAHARRAQKDEVERLRALLERAIRQLIYVTQGHTSDGDIDCVIQDYERVKGNNA